MVSSSKMLRSCWRLFSMAYTKTSIGQPTNLPPFSPPFTSLSSLQGEGEGLQRAERQWWSTWWGGRLWSMELSPLKKSIRRRRPLSRTGGCKGQASITLHIMILSPAAQVCCDMQSVWIQQCALWPLHVSLPPSTYGQHIQLGGHRYIQIVCYPLSS